MLRSNAEDGLKYNYQLGNGDVLVMKARRCSQASLICKNDECFLSFPALQSGGQTSGGVQGTTQDHWRHAVPKRKRDPDGRINLTFRKIVHKEGRSKA